MTPWAVTAVFLASGVTGLSGLLVGRWGADRFGRRVTAGVAPVTAAAMGVTTYSGDQVLLAIGFPLTVLANSALSPAAGALDAEVFTSEVRATAAGWLTGAQVVGSVAGLFAFGLLWIRLARSGRQHCRSPRLRPSLRCCTPACQRPAVASSTRPRRRDAIA